MKAHALAGIGENADPDSSTAIAAALLAGMVGNLFFMGAPFVVGALVDTAGLSEQQAGNIVSADMAGLALGALITYFVVNHYDRRLLGAVGSGFFIGANLLSMAFPQPEVLPWVRVLAGVGSGVLYSLSVANLSCTRDTARNFSILLFLILSLGAAEALMLPAMSASMGINGIFLVFVVAAVVALPTLLWLMPCPDSGSAKSAAAEPGVHEAAAALPRSLPMFYLLAVFAFTLLIGVVWTYAERAGIAANIASATVNRVVFVANLCGIAGALVAASLARRWGQSKTLLVCLCSVAVVLVVMGSAMNFRVYTVGLIIFSALWVMVNIYQMGTLANLDRTGRCGSLLPFAQDVAASAGSAMGAGVLGAGFGYPALFYLGACFSIASFCIFLPAYLRVRRQSVVLADAP